MEIYALKVSNKKQIKNHESTKSKKHEKLLEYFVVSFFRVFVIIILFFNPGILITLKFASMRSG